MTANTVCLLIKNLCLTLHRGGTYPDPTGDREVYEMTYSLYTHGAFALSNVVCKAYLLNYPCMTADGTAGIPSFISLSADNIICESVKPAALRENEIILRLYEAERCGVKCRLTLPGGYIEAYRANFLEDIRKKPKKDGAVDLAFSAFRIVSVMPVK